MGPAIGQLLKTFVIFHGQCHVTFLTFKTGFVPYLKNNINT